MSKANIYVEGGYTEKVGTHCDVFLKQLECREKLSNLRFSNARHSTQNTIPPAIKCLD